MVLRYNKYTKLNLQVVNTIAYSTTTISINILESLELKLC